MTVTIPADLDLTCTGGELLAWLHAHYPGGGTDTAATVAALAGLSAVGVTRVDQGDTFTDGTIRALQDLAGAGCPAALTVSDVHRLWDTGWRVWHQGTPTEWEPVVAARMGLPSGRDQYTPGAAIDAWITTGVTPLGALAVCAAAAVVDADPLLYGARITGDQYQALAAAEVTDAREVAVYERAGLTIEQAGSMATAGAPAGACLAGVELGIPTDQWVTVFAGWHPTWAPLPERFEDPTGWSPVAKGLIGHGWPVAALTALAGAGWGGLSATHARVGLHATATARGGDLLRLTPESAVAAARAGLTPRQVAGLYGALTTGGRVTVRLLPYEVGLLDNVRHDTDMTVLEVMVTLDRRGVKPSHLTEFKQAGCASIADLFTALDVGITAADAKRLRVAHGAMTSLDNTRRFKDVSTLIEAYTAERDRNA